MVERCPWSGEDVTYISYHDEEWGVPVHDDRHLFEMLVLEGAQAGLSWLTILRKRGGYRRAFDGFDAERIARYSDREVQRLLGDARIVRNRRKIEAAIANAAKFLELRGRDGGFDRFLWRYVDFEPRQNRWHTMAEVPSRTAASEAMSRDLQRLGFRFVGPTICYAFMQSVGMVNDHLTRCFRHREIGDCHG